MADQHGGKNDPRPGGSAPNQGQGQKNRKKRKKKRGGGGQPPTAGGHQRGGGGRGQGRGRRGPPNHQNSSRENHAKPGTPKKSPAPEPRLPMNPFDFVPWFATGPDVRHWEAEAGEGGLLSGSVRLTVTPLTPLHVAGIIEAKPEKKIDRRCFYRQNGRPCLPGSSLRGVLRAYVEALTNGWFAAVSDEYKKDRRRRDPVRIRPRGTGKNARKNLALPWAFQVPDRLQKASGGGRRLDAAAFLFGVVCGGDSEEGGEGVRGRVTVDDVYFPGDLGQATSLDLDQKSTFGGPHPVQNNFWYFTPGEVRIVKKRSFQVVEPWGRWLRGRKFYYHHDPAACIGYYKEHWRDLKDVPTEVVPVGRASEAFTLRFQRLPEPLLGLLLAALEPPGGLRHKLGALKPFGFGSVRFEIDQVSLDPSGEALLGVGNGQTLDRAAVLQRFGGHLRAEGPPPLAHPEAWAWLSHLLHWPETLEGNHRCFAYPQFRPNPRKKTLDAVANGFARVVNVKDINGPVPGVPDAAKKALKAPNDRFGDLGAIQALVEALWADSKAGKQPVELSTYQTRARNFEAVCADGGPDAKTMRELHRAATWGRKP